jgi:hypothetical protein
MRVLPVIRIDSSELLLRELKEKNVDGQYPRYHRGVAVAVDHYTKKRE